MSEIPGGNELGRHMAGVAPSQDRAGTRPTSAAASTGGGTSFLAQSTKSDPVTAVLIAGAVGYGLGWLTALSRAPRHDPLPDYARKRA